MLRLRATPIRRAPLRLASCLGLVVGLASLAAGQEPAAAAAGPGPSPAPPPVANPYGRKYPPRVYRTVRLQGKPPVIDGGLDDEAWRQGEWSGGYRQQIPTEGAPPSKPTELKILFDDRNVYMAIRVHDDPDKVHRYPARRDDMVGDIVGVCFDSYNDKRTGFEFDLTAGGGKIDLLLFGETEWDTTWDAVWDGKVAHDERGWAAEFRVPLNQLRYGPQDEQVWGLHAWRWIDRNKEEDQWQLIPRQNTGRMYQLGELRGIHGLPRPHHVELLPHVLGKTSSGPSVPGGGSEAAGSAGLDAKVGLTSNFTLDATVNPDFGQVEADPSVVNLTAYETFYEEKRPFFLEGRKILSFGIEEQDQLFYSRRVGAPPSGLPFLAPGETASLPDNTTILGAFKVTGKTDAGLSVAALQAFTQKETVAVASPLGGREAAVEPFGSFTVGRLHKDWDKGNTSLGGMLTSTHRWVSDASLAFLPSQATTGGLDFARYFANRSWLLEASGVASRVSGDPAAILALQTNAVHYYQRPDATQLQVDPTRRSLSGHGGFLRFGRSENSRLHLLDHFHWYSPGLDLNDVGYLRQADLLANQAFLGWSEPRPKGLFRNYSVQLMREDQWDFGGLATRSSTQLDASSQFANKWEAAAMLAYRDVVDTRMLRGGPALRWHDYLETSLSAQTDSSRRVWAKLTGGYSRAYDDDSRASNLSAYLNLRLSNRLSLSGSTSYEHLLDNLQYVATTGTDGDPRWVLGRIDQDTWSLTFRVNLSITPDLTVQYYGSPFIGTGRYAAFRQATDSLAKANSERFHLYGPDEIAYRADANAYQVTEAGGGPSYSFANPDFSFRQFRSNLVARWEYKPGSSLYVVWSQGRTDQLQSWEGSFSGNWNALWGTRADNVFLVKLSYWFSP
jgi:hypothetical protein